MKNCGFWHPTLQGFHVPSISSEVLALGDDVCVVLLSGLLLFFSFFFTLKPAQFGFCTHFQGKYSNIRYDFKDSKKQESIN